MKATLEGDLGSTFTILLGEGVLFFGGSICKYKYLGIKKAHTTI